uniref:Uncharacterized protein n=1 Tax=Candidatus Kentrum sp. SD TaxID=2126332 RepID=A0A450YGT5_9GAMM|nr:MAG: hypothetical protein BECKSD772F_GA0070984_10692 [Candidatus Kentron sp. SD]VFK46167.1 MAG: hypothetical protein BECKSD772E_GA0070983_10682 [Candidatus Kentron sp. SD]
MPHIPPPPCPLNSHAEWDPLEEVIIGNPEGVFAAFWDPLDRMVYFHRG